MTVAVVVVMAFVAWMVTAVFVVALMVAAGMADRESERIGEIRAEELEAARRDPRVVALHAKADARRAELLRGGR